MYQSTSAAEKIRQQAIERAEELNAQWTDKEGIDGFKVTAEQCRAMNAGEREAVDKFFAENERRLKRLAKCFLRRVGLPLRWDKKYYCWQPAIIEIEDCLHQLYVDMRSGYLVFAMVPKIFARVICHSYRYAGVGGFGEEDGVYVRGVKECQSIAK